MEELMKAIHTTPIIDNHAHPLLIPSVQGKYPLLAITTEAHGNAMKNAPSTLSHIRAVNQLSEILGCPATWDDVVKAIEVEKSKPGDVWSKRCLEGIETILVDDGLDGKAEVFDYAWHDRLTRSKCKRIVRIEKVAEEIIDQLLKMPSLSPSDIFHGLIRDFGTMIKESIADPEVVGFKSVICYRTGLNIPPLLTLSEVKSAFVSHISELKSEGIEQFRRIDGQPLNAFLVHMTASIIESATSKLKKPLQFHTGLGDNDITLTKSSPSHLQEFIRKFPVVPIVLLHASYPWTQEAGYLASVYDNVYADIGEVFPFLSREGQERVVREILELTPSEKILWSTDGHWFPETYILAIIQVREALEVVLSDYVRQKVLTEKQAVKVVEDVLFNTSNILYDLKLPLKPLITSLSYSAPKPSSSAGSNLKTLSAFLEHHPSTKFLRLQYLDYTATPRLRVLPVKRALSLLQGKEADVSIGITSSTFGMLQNDTLIPEVTACGEYRLHPIFSSLRPGPAEGYASVQCEFRESNGSQVPLCSRSLLRRTLENAKFHGLEFLAGFEIEIIFMSRSSPESGYTSMPDSGGHSWNSTRAFHGKNRIRMLNEIYDTLVSAGIYLEQWHPESASGQYEFVLPPLPPLEAVDMLLHAREIISTVVAGYDMRATLYPKPFPMQAGTASHVHISISSLHGDRREIYGPFYAGVLGHLRAIAAFTYSNAASYDRVVDGCWAGGRWVTWGSQNRETALRKIEGSHWEIKCLDGLANVYLALAAIFAAGLNGALKGEKLLWGDCRIDPATLSKEERKQLGIEKMLPESLDEAIGELLADGELREILGNDVVLRYVAVKKAEMNLLQGMQVEARKEWLIERY